MKQDIVNISNHDPASWSTEQKDQWQTIFHIPHPAISAKLSGREVYELAQRIVRENYDKICMSGNVCVQGEFTFTLSVVDVIRKTPSLSHVMFWVPTSDRVSVETIDSNGVVTKKSEFRFVQWREVWI